jgi:hypothetical protein
MCKRSTDSLGLIQWSAVLSSRKRGSHARPESPLKFLNSTLGLSLGGWPLKFGMGPTGTKNLEFENWSGGPL